jgi:carbohydrate kinase (thermoresistant glucokinase family)
MGVSGSGKSTIARALADRLGWDFAEGDSLHPAANVAKMAAGTPLTDDDRWPWLDRIAAWIADERTAGRSGVITCSALRRRYRDVLRGAGVRFVYLRGSRALLAERMERRVGHFMPTSLLDSQLETLEEPSPDEDALSVDVGGTPEQAVEEIVTRLRS